MRHLFWFVLFSHFGLCISLTCYSQLCLEDDTCSDLSTCETTNGYCYNRIFSGRFGHFPTSGVVRGIESGCSTEFTSLMLGRCAGDLEDEEYTCVCSANLCNRYFLDGDTEIRPIDKFTLRRIRCVEDDQEECDQRVSPCQTEGKTFCALQKLGPSSSSSSRLLRHGRIGYWPLIEYAHLAVNEVVCIQGLSRDHVIECYCKRDNCNSVKEEESEKVVRIDRYSRLSKCLMESRFYEITEQLSINDSSPEHLPPLNCIGHSCYITYERDLNASRPWIRVQRGCMNYSRPSAFFDYSMDTEFGPRQRGTRLCKSDLCNNITIRVLATHRFSFSQASFLSVPRYYLALIVIYFFTVHIMDENNG